MVGLAQMVRASDCGPEGRRFDPDIPPHNPIFPGGPFETFERPILQG